MKGLMKTLLPVIILAVLMACAAKKATNPSLNASFFVAIQNNDITSVKALLDEGADVNAKDRYSRTPLIKAIERGNYNIISLLIEKGADVNVKDDLGDTPLKKAKERNNEGIVTLLEKSGAK